jgi:hypothetical protein
MKTHNNKLVIKPQKKLPKMTDAEWKSTVQKWTIPSFKWNSTITECYTKFCSLQARREAAKYKLSRLHNVLVCLHNSSTIVEGNNSMKAGDIGRLMNVWKMWAVMSQSIDSLKHYSVPRLIFLLTKALSPLQSNLMCHNILMLTSGRSDHYMAKDHFMEHQDYWLKHFFNGGGIGTQIDQLKKLFSMNIFLVRTLFSLLLLSVVQKAHRY